MTYPGNQPRVGERFRPYKRFRKVAVIPNALLEYRGLSSTAKLAWARLAQHAGKNGACYPSLNKLSRELAKSRSATLSALNELITQGFLEREPPANKDKGQRKTTAYFFLWHAIFHTLPSTENDTRSDDETDPYLVSKTDIPSVENDTLPSSVNDTRLVSKMTPKEVPLKESKKRTPPPGEPDLASSSLKNGGGGVSSFGKTEKQKPPHLTPEQEDYLKLVVDHQEQNGGFRTSKAAFKRWLTKELVDGRRDMSDREDLEAWKVDCQAKEDRACLREEEHRRYVEEQQKRERQAEQETKEREAAVKAIIDDAGDKEAMLRSIFSNKNPLPQVPLVLVQMACRTLYPELCVKIESEQLESKKQDALKRLGLAPRQPKKAKSKKEQIIGLIARCLHEGNHEQIEALSQKYPAEHEAALEIVAADQSEDMTF